MSGSTLDGQSGRYATRSLDVLRKIGAVDETKARLMKRAVSLLRDGPVQTSAIEISAEALRQLDLPLVQPTLFANEQRLKPALWKSLEWDTVSRAGPRVEPPQTAVVDASKMTTGANPEQPYPIAKLPLNLRVLARRVQQLSDGESAETCLKNVELAIGHAGLPYEDQRLLEKLRWFLTDATSAKGAPFNQAIAEVPYPGELLIDVPHSGSTALRLIQRTEIREVAGFDPEEGLRRRLHMYQDVAIQVEVPPREQLVFLHHDRQYANQDLVLEPGTHAGPTMAGLYRLERWRNGKRIESSDVDLTHSFQAQHEDLNPFADFQLRHNGDPVPRVLEKTVDHNAMHRDGRRQTTAHFVYSFEAKPEEAEVDPMLVPKPNLAIDSGRYRPTNYLTLEAFDSGAVRAKVDGGQFQPLLRQFTDDSREVRLLTPTSTEFTLRLWPDGALWISPNDFVSQETTIELKPEMRAT